MLDLRRHPFPGASLTCSRAPLALLLSAWLALPTAAGAFDEVEGKRLFDEEDFGGNGRRCVTCHSVATGTISPEDVQDRLAADPGDPLFQHDGTDDGISGTTRIAEHATIRVDKPLPEDITIAEDPSAVIVTLLRGVPSTINTPALDPSLMYDRRAPTLQCQAIGAIEGHAQTTATASELDDIAAFEQADPRFFSSQELMDYAEMCGKPDISTSGCPTDPSPPRPADQTDACQPEPALPAVAIDTPEWRGRNMFLDVPIVPGETPGICAVCHSGPMLNQGNGLNNHLTDGENIPPPVGQRVGTAGVSERNLLGNPEFTFLIHVDGEPPVSVVSPDPGLLLQPEFRGNPAFEPDFEANFFKIPQLWGVAGTAPYFHDNSAKDLWEMAEHYSWFFQNIEPFDQHFPNGLSAQDRHDMVSFLVLLPEPGIGALWAGAAWLFGLARIRRRQRRSTNPGG